jgi:putative transcription antitermination factor YqgF
MNPLGRVLALDLGKKRIGLAISDGLGITAQGLDTLARINKRTDLAILAKLIQERGVTQILMGNPLHMSGRESRQSEWTQEFARDLERRHSGENCQSVQYCEKDPTMKTYDFVHLVLHAAGNEIRELCPRLDA